MMVKEFSLSRSGTKAAVLVPIMALLILTFCSREREYELENPQTTYSDVELHLDGKRSEELGKPIDTYYTSSGEPFTGTQKIYYSDTDSLHMKQFFQEGIQTGAVIYYDDGDIVRQKHGIYLNKPLLKKMYENGILVYENIPPTESEDGMGHVRLWHKNGQLSVEHSYTGDQVKQGLMTEYDEEGNITKQGRYEDGELVEMIKEREI
ncbi:MAG: hypothetical protein U5J95_07625 [Balneolaceae bacterium]|nr:hypothetical protein [Balneolaceae bacterium]